MYYKDFFDPPPKVPSSKSKGKEKAIPRLKLKGPNPTSPMNTVKKTSKVRFHEEVKVRNIKAKGKNLPLSTMYDDDEEDDDDEYGEQMDFEDFEGEVDSDLSRDGEDEIEGPSIGNDDDFEDEDDTEDGSDADNGRDTIARLKDDLFADEEETPDGVCDTNSIACLVCLSFYQRT